MKIGEIIRKYKLIIIAIIFLSVIVIGSSFALFVVNISGNTTNKIKLGSLVLNLDETASNGISINPAYPLTDQEGLANTPKYIFTLKNDGTLNADFTIQLTDITTANKKMAYSVIRYNLKKQLYDSSSNLKTNQPADRTGYLSDLVVGSKIILDEGTLQSHEKTTYTLNIWMDYDAGNEYQGSAFKGKLKIDGTQQYTKISNAYSYDEVNADTLCITGNESTCVSTNCYKSGNTCNSGDIIDYMVNATQKVRFHVMYDESGVITMQTQSNVASNIAWNSTDSNENGPTTILSALDTATVSWTNPKDLSYTLGTTIFKTNSATGCSAYNLCSDNKYTLQNKVAKTRLITVQEAALLGCTSTTDSCPSWMRSTNGGYWMSNASSSNDTDAFVINNSIITSNAISATNGIRAVIQINK